MINTQSEHLIIMSEVPNHVPKRRGRKVHLASPYRWAKAGLSGVRLETIYIAGAQYTSTEALERCWHRLTAVNTGISNEPASKKRATAAHSRAMRELEEAGI